MLIRTTNTKPPLAFSELFRARKQTDVGSWERHDVLYVRSLMHVSITGKANRESVKPIDRHPIAKILYRNHARMVRANLEAILELTLPSPATSAKADYSADCGICYGYRLQKQQRQGNGAGAAGGGADSRAGGAKTGLLVFCFSRATSEGFSGSARRLRDYRSPSTRDRML